MRSLLSETGAEALPNWLETRRWFADKGRGISEVAIEDALVERVGLDWLALAVARVAFADGNAARYLLPLALTESPAETRSHRSGRVRRRQWRDRRRDRETLVWRLAARSVRRSN